MITLLEAPKVEALSAVLADLGLPHEAIAVEDLRYASNIKSPTLDAQLKKRRVVGGGSALISTLGLGSGFPRTTRAMLSRLQKVLADDGHFLLHLPGRPSDADLCPWRDHLWPELHATAFYRSVGGRLERTLLAGRTAVAGALPEDAAVLVFRRREKVTAPEEVARKFDQNASSWNGLPGTPGYSHYRWMRRLVGRFAPAAPRARILDFGSGTGWVGIEAALRSPESELSAFDPSPEMVRLAQENARASGLTRFRAQVGFGEAPPYPTAGEPAFDQVFCSGVLSFAHDLEAWYAGLSAAVAPGGRLVIGDLNPESAGMRRRRRTHPLLPVREMNARTASAVAAALAARGFELEEAAGYQLTTPVPELLHWGSRGPARALGFPLVLGLGWANSAAAALDRAVGGRMPSAFDSWVMRLRKRS